MVLFKKFRNVRLQIILQHTVIENATVGVIAIDYALCNEMTTLSLLTAATSSTTEAVNRGGIFVHLATSRHHHL
jgi:hypothetical protein